MKETRQIFICDCGSPDHQFIVEQWIDDDLDFTYFTFYVHLTLWSFWRRLIIGIRYIFNTQKAAFEEVLLKRAEVVELRDALNDFLKDTESKEKEKEKEKYTICACHVKSYRGKQCPNCKHWFCPSCFSEHVSNPNSYCPKVTINELVCFEIKNGERSRLFDELIEKYFKQQRTKNAKVRYSPR